MVSNKGEERGRSGFKEEGRKGRNFFDGKNSVHGFASTLNSPTIRKSLLKKRNFAEIFNENC